MIGESDADDARVIVISSISSIVIDTTYTYKRARVSFALICLDDVCVDRLNKTNTHTTRHCLAL